jgi:hypothetical protein
MLTLFDGIVGLFYALILLGGAWLYKNHQLNKGYANYRFYLPSLLAHIVGVTGFCLVYGFYYGGGDSYYYFRGGKSLVEMFFIYPIDTFKIIPLNISDIPYDLKYIVSWLGEENGEDTFLTMKLSAFFCFFGGNSFLGASILLSALSFVANWSLFKVINSSLYNSGVYAPKLYYILFIPSLLFWGTGILKDTFVFIFLVFIFNFVVSVFTKTKRNGNVTLFALFILGIVFSSFMMKLKGYVFYSLILSLVVTYFNEITKIPLAKQKKVVGYFINFILLTIVGGIMVLGFQSFQKEILIAEKETISTIQGFHSWHTILGGSSYSLGITEYTFFGIFSKAPLAILVTYFGPFPWEVKSPVMLFTALESYFYFILFLRFLIKRKWKLFFPLANNSILKFAIIYTLVFGALVGITSYNYGALARFKIQALPFFLLWLSSSKLNKVT